MVCASVSRNPFFIFYIFFLNFCSSTLRPLLEKAFCSQCGVRQGLSSRWQGHETRFCLLRSAHVYRTAWATASAVPTVRLLVSRTRSWLQLLLSLQTEVLTGQPHLMLAEAYFWTALLPATQGKPQTNEKQAPAIDVVSRGSPTRQDNPLHLMAVSSTIFSYWLSLLPSPFLIPPWNCK